MRRIFRRLIDVRLRLALAAALIGLVGCDDRLLPPAPIPADVQDTAGIVYSGYASASPSDDEIQVYRIPTTGGNRTHLFEGALVAVSANGTMLCLGQTPSGVEELQVISANNGTVLGKFSLPSDQVMVSADLYTDSTTGKITVAVTAYDFINAATTVQIMTTDGAFSSYSISTSSGLNSSINYPVRFSPDGRRIAFYGPDILSEYVIMIMEVANGFISTINVPAPIYMLPNGFDWSPQSDRLVFVAQEYTFVDSPPIGVLSTGLYIAEIGAPLPPVALFSDTTTNSYSDPVWSPDGSKIAFLQQRPYRYDIWTVNANGGAPQAVTSTPAEIELCVEWSPKGTSILFTGITSLYSPTASDPISGTLQVIDIATLKSRVLATATHCGSWLR